MSEFSYTVRVYYEDTDSGGVVYHANYLQFMERARTEWLRALGFEQDELISKNDVIFAVRHMDIDFKLPARFNDLLDVSVVVEQVGRASLTLDQEIRRKNEQEVLCNATVKIASLSASQFKPCALPENIKKRL